MERALIPLRIFVSLTCLVMVYVLLCSGNTYAQLADSPWPMYLGNLGHTGHGLANTSHVDGEVIWNYDLQGNEWAESSPVIGPDNTIYYAVHNNLTGVGKLYAINPDGTEKWPQPFATGQGQFISDDQGMGFWKSVQSTPAIASDGTIYLLALDNKLHAINSVDGNPKQGWGTPAHVPVDKDIWSSPAIGPDGVIYVGSRHFSPDDQDPLHPDPGNFVPGKVYAYHADNPAQPLWTFDTGSDISSSPAIALGASPDDYTIYIGSGDGRLYAINNQGQQQWAFNIRPTEDDLWFIESAPTIGPEGNIYFGAGYQAPSGDYQGKLFAIDPHNLDAGSGLPELLWTFPAAGTLDSEVWSSPAIGPGGTLYIGTGGGGEGFPVDHNLYALDPANGEMIWSFATEGHFESSPVVGADGTIYIGAIGVQSPGMEGSESNKLYAINPDGTVKWQFNVPCCGWVPSVAIGADGTVYAANDKLYAFGAENKLISVAGREQALLAADTVEGDLLGFSVAIDGDILVLGAKGDDVVGINSGSVYTYRWNGTSWEQQQKLVPSDAASVDNFGQSVAIDGDTIVVGSWIDDHSGLGNAGSAYVFSWDGTTWVEQQKIIATDAAFGDKFGYEVGIDGDAIVVGALGDDDGGVDAGSAYVFRKNGNQWLQEGKLIAGDASAGDWFGISVAIDGDTAIVGARYDDDGQSNAGSAYVFRYDGSQWTQVSKLLANRAIENEQFGESVTIAGNRVVVGAYAPRQHGAAYVFEYDGTGWNQKARLGASDSRPNNQFGLTVALHGETLVVGARMDSAEAGFAAGAAYVYRYRRSTENWIEQIKLTATDAQSYSWFGWDVDIDGDQVVVGSYLKDNYTGSAYVYGLAANTPTGSNVKVRPIDTETGTYPVEMRFPQVSTEGVSSLSTSATGPALTGSFQWGNPPTYFNLASNASYAGPVEVCIDHSEIEFASPLLTMMQFVGGVMSGVPDQKFKGNRVICAEFGALPLQLAIAAIPDGDQDGIPDEIEGAVGGYGIEVTGGRVIDLEYGGPGDDLTITVENGGWLAEVTLPDGTGTSGPDAAIEIAFTPSDTEPQLQILNADLPDGTSKQVVLPWPDPANASNVIIVDQEGATTVDLSSSSAGSDGVYVIAIPSTSGAQNTLDAGGGVIYTVTNDDNVRVIVSGLQHTAVGISSMRELTPSAVRTDLVVLAAGLLILGLAGYRFYRGKIAAGKKE